MRKNLPKGRKHQQQYVCICSTPNELDPAQYGVSATAVHSVHSMLYVGPTKLHTGDLVALLEDLYCGPIAVEFLHLQVYSLSVTVQPQ